jgi:hypothetical protein
VATDGGCALPLGAFRRDYESHCAMNQRAETSMTNGGTIAWLDILGVRVSAVDIPIAIAEVDRWIRRGYRSYATLTGVHGIMESVRSASADQI